MFRSLCQDVAYAVRSFSKTPALTAVIIVSIGLGIAASTTVFGIVNGLLIRDMPVRDPGRLYIVEPAGSPSASIPAYRAFRDQTVPVFEGLAAHSLIPVAANMSAGGGAQRVWGLLVSGNYFSVVGVQPVLGRAILPFEDEVRGRDAVVVLGYGLWQRLGGDPAVLGKRIPPQRRSLHRHRRRASRLLRHKPGGHGGVLRSTRDALAPGAGYRRQRRKLELPMARNDRKAAPGRQP